ncbi:MAG: hypothetical protein ACRDKI_10775 [Solirubrobacterales bacterium]
MAYRPSLASRVRAFFLTDRVGHTIASTLGIFAILRWWVGQRLPWRR